MFTYLLSTIIFGFWGANGRGIFTETEVNLVKTLSLAMGKFEIPLSYAKEEERV